MSNYAQNNDDILDLPVGYVAQIVTKRADVFVGTITNVDILEETATIENGVVLTYEPCGFVERYLTKQIIYNNEVASCLSVYPLWSIMN